MVVDEVLMTVIVVDVLVPLVELLLLLLEPPGTHACNAYADVVVLAAVSHPVEVWASG